MIVTAQLLAIRPLWHSRYEDDIEFSHFSQQQKKSLCHVLPKHTS